MKPVRLPRKRPQQRRSQEMVDAILDAAAEVFCTEGFDQATTNAVAERAGVSIGSFYQYFPNKLALLEALRDRHVRGLWEKIGVACDEVAARLLPLPDAFRHIIGQCSAYNAPHIALLATMHQVLPIHSQTADRMMLAQAILRQKLKTLLEAHRSSIKVNIDQALFMIPALGRGIFTSAAIEQPDAVKNEQFVEDVVSAILGYLT
jgi:AcrR family transcriptional regulator